MDAFIAWGLINIETAGSIKRGTEIKLGVKLIIFVILLTNFP